MTMDQLTKAVAAVLEHGGERPNRIAINPIDLKEIEGFMQLVPESLECRGLHVLGCNLEVYLAPDAPRGVLTVYHHECNADEDDGEMCSACGGWLETTGRCSYCDRMGVL
jgi:hypothetical protein